MLAPFAGNDGRAYNCDVAKWLKPGEGHLTTHSSPFVMWLAFRLALNA